MNNPFDLSGRTAVVTGAGTGLGRGMSLALAAAGADLLLVDRQIRTEVAEEVRGMGRRAETLQVDLTDPGAVETVMAAVRTAFGRVDILVNNAGTIRRAPVLEVTAEDWDAVMALNSRSVFFLAQAAARDMVPRKHGKIINIASLLSFQGGILVPAYTASKGAVAQVTKALANELAPAGVNVNAIAPGYMATDNTTALRQDPVRSAAILERIPAARWGLPADLGGAVVFLASSASDYVHGHVLVVDGGWLAR
jgi:2-deoxy-D-gluconate 3-dehydrogenase